MKWLIFMALEQQHPRHPTVVNNRMEYMKLFEIFHFCNSSSYTYIQFVCWINKTKPIPEKKRVQSMFVDRIVIGFRVSQKYVLYIYITWRICGIAFSCYSGKAARKNFTLPPHMQFRLHFRHECLYEKDWANKNVEFFTIKTNATVFLYICIIWKKFN